MDFFKSKNNIILLSILGALILIFLILVIVFGFEDNEKVLLECEKNISLPDSTEVVENLKLQEISGKRVFKATIKRDIKDMNKDDIKSIKEYFDYYMKENYSDLNNITYDIISDDNSIIFNLELKENEKNKDDLISDFEYDFLYETPDKLKKDLEGSGFACKK